MAGKRRPMDVNLSVVDGGKGKHWTKAEVEVRKSSEPKLPKPKALKPPAWLSDPAKKLFKSYAKQLLEFPAGVISSLDAGTLARYCDCELAYGEASAQKSFWLEVSRRRLEGICNPDMVATPGQDVQMLESAYEEAKEQIAFWINQMAKLEKIARGCATEMGMTVSSRCRLVVPNSGTAEEADPLEELQKQLFGG